MGRIHAILSDGTVVTDVEARPISHLLFYIFYAYSSHYVYYFSFQISIEHNFTVLYLSVCVCVCKYACVHVLYVNMYQPMEGIRKLGETKHHQ